MSVTIGLGRLCCVVYSWRELVSLLIVDLKIGVGRAHIVMFLVAEDCYIISWFFFSYKIRVPIPQTSKKLKRKLNDVIAKIRINPRSQTAIVNDVLFYFHLPEPPILL